MNISPFKSHQKAKGAFGNILQVLCEKVISLFLLAYLARVLPAEVFGFTAAFMVFVEVGSMLSSSGTTASLITRPSLNKETIDTLFTVSFLLGLSFFLLFILFSQIITSFLNFHGQQFYLCMVASIMFLQGLGAVPKALMSKDLRFVEISKISFLSTVIGCILSVFTSFSSFSFFSLFCFYFIQSLLNSCLLFKVCPFRPFFSFRFSLLKDLSTVSLPASTSGFIGMLTDKLIPLSIGKWLGPSELGLFSLAVRPCAVVWQVLVSSFQRICLPIISAFQEQVIDDKKLAQFLLPVFLFVFPISVFIFCNSEGIILILFGETFKEASPLRSLASSSMFILSLSYMGEAFFLSSKNPSDLYIALFIRFFCVCLILSLFLRFGSLAVLVGINFLNLTSTLLIFILLYKRMKLNFFKALLIHIRLFWFLFLYCCIVVFAKLLGFSFYLSLLLSFICYYLILSFYFRIALLASPKKYFNCFLNIFD